MKKLVYLFLATFLLACGPDKIDHKEYCDNEISVETYTLVKDEIQSSSPNTSIICVTKDGKTSNVLVYDSHGVNNISIEIKNKKIIIESLDSPTDGVLRNSENLKKSVFGYDVDINFHSPDF